MQPKSRRRSGFGEPICNRSIVQYQDENGVFTGTIESTVGLLEWRGIRRWLLGWGYRAVQPSDTPPSAWLGCRPKVGVWGKNELTRETHQHKNHDIEELWLGLTWPVLSGHRNRSPNSAGLVLERDIAAFMFSLLCAIQRATVKKNSQILCSHNHALFHWNSAQVVHKLWRPLESTWFKCNHPTTRFRSNLAVALCQCNTSVSASWSQDCNHPSPRFG